MTVPRTEMKGLVLAMKLFDAALVSINEPTATVTCCLNSEFTISAVESENGLLKPYLANRRAVVIGKLQEWKEKFPETDSEPLQHIAGPLNPADLSTRSSCSTSEVERNTPWQNGPEFLKLPREEWPVTRDFKNKIPEEEVVQTIKDPCQCSDCEKALKPQDSSCFQSFCHMLIRTNSIKKAPGVVTRVLCTSRTIKDRILERPG